MTPEDTLKLQAIMRVVMPMGFKIERIEQREDSRLAIMLVSVKDHSAGEEKNETGGSDNA